ncbi:MAG TPA: DUF4838 domain-containing protein, partial [Terrimicrobiaceae bacterium]|nr:DUF4838 domain-containing protein [Terrimicrobiaceae bacterium]
MNSGLLNISYMHSFLRSRLLCATAFGWIFSLAASATGWAADRGVTLTEKGKPEAVLVVPDGSGKGDTERQAARLFQELVKRLSGATLPIKQEKELPALHASGDWIKQGQENDTLSGNEGVPGEQAAIEQPSGSYVIFGPCKLASELGAGTAQLPPGGFAIRAAGNAVVLAGGPASVEGEALVDGGGLGYAVIELLRQLGVECLWPGESGWVIPKKPDIAIAYQEKTEAPVIKGRGIRYSQAVPPRRDAVLKSLALTEDEWLGARKKALESSPSIPWSQWHRLGGTLPVFFHAGAGLRNGADQMKEHPEWFALQADGTRDQGGDRRFQLCMSNQELINHVAQDIIERVNQDPSIRIVSLDPNDGGTNTGVCLCPACEALDPPEAPRVKLMTFGEPNKPGAIPRQRAMVDHASLTDRMLHYWNAVAEIVVKKHPNLLLGISSYSYWTHPPVREKVHPNLVLRYVAPDSSKLAGWRAAGARRIYWRPNVILQGRRDGKIRCYVDKLADSFRDFVDAGVIQTDFDSIVDFWSTSGINYYAAARLEWDPYLTSDQIIADYARAGFGQGAPQIEAYFHHLQELTSLGIAEVITSEDQYRFTPKVMAELRGMLDAAEKSANDSEVSRRIAFLRMGLNYTELQETLGFMAWQANSMQKVDRELARRLVDLNCLIVRDTVKNNHFAMGHLTLVPMSSNFAAFSPIGGRTVTPSKPELLERLKDPQYGLTGRENSLAEMLAAYGL